MRSPGMRFLLSCIAFCGAAALSAALTLVSQAVGLHQTRILHDPLIRLPADLTVGSTAATSDTVFLPVVGGPPPARVLIGAAHIDSSVSYEPDEAIMLWNAGDGPQDLAGWQIVAGNRRATIPLTATLTLAGGQRIWCAAEREAFHMTFGEEPDCVWTDAGSPTDAPPVLLDGELSFTNRGGAIRLQDAAGETVDVLLYGDEGAAYAGWQGAPVQPYARGAIPAAGQILTRKQNAHALRPQDTDRATDWASDLADTRWGRRVRYPGWQGWTAADGALPALGMADANVVVAIGPEGLYETLATALGAAQERIDLSIYTLEHPELTGVLAAAAQRGVAVRILLEGSPPGGVTQLQRWCVDQLAPAGVEIFYLAARPDAPNGLRPRFRYAHAKYGVIDGRTALVGTDNFNRDSMPVEPDRGGRRGVYLLTDAPPVLAELQRIFDQDWAPETFADLRPYDPADDRYGAPPADFEPPVAPSYATADSDFAQPLRATDTAQFGILSAPENALRPDAGLMDLLAQAGPDDEILAQQLYEHKFWGDSDSNPVADPNPRLQAMIEAARRGASVRLLLDSFFDDPRHLRSNLATVEYVRAVAAAEELDLDARRANPTGGGIHAKMILVRLGGANWSAVGSLNGSENSHKLNREIVLLTDMSAVHARLTEVFWHDWQAGE